MHEGLNGPGGLAEYALLDDTNLYKMAPDVDPAHAALTEPLACCVHSIEKGCIGFADDVVVMGAGIMGAFHIKLAKLRGARVIACELDADRLEIARQMGADVLIDSGKSNAVDMVKQLTDGRGADVVFCTVASPLSAAEAVEMTGKLGRVVMYSSFHPKKPIELDVNKVHYSEMNITGSVNPRIRDFQVASRLLSLKIIDPSLLISKQVLFANLHDAFEHAIESISYRRIVKMKQRIEWVSST